jgi:Domain of unknown function (DUF4145)
MVAALAWPVTIVIVALLFRKRIEAVLARPAKRWKIGPVEAEWEESTGEASVELAKAQVELGAPAPAEGDSRTKELLAIAGHSPRAAVMDAATELEHALRAYLRQQGMDFPPNRTSLGALAREARGSGLLSAEEADVIERLARLRNLAAHAVEPVSLDQAVDFITLSNGVLMLVELKSTIHRADEGK